ncbi:hypothetical protein GOP47_0015631 [Adiantum capillus-veneris]|uniref:X8 domain-containing protein n=1 Tax=Adiantum capillus-veneris TaxID=13818 RepID=A0A9D4UK34_ADICA|nr:hypothetical protein GOP47_0015631 [Adiantum capillus-veneris]
MVSLLKANQVDKVKLFNSDTSVLRALANSDIEVMNNVVRFRLSGTNIRYVAVGDEPFKEGYNDTYSASIYPALKNIQNALHNADIQDQVKATVPMSFDVLLNAGLPSQAIFKEGIAPVVTQIAAFLAQNGCPFTININPFLTVYSNRSYVVDDAFFDREASPVADGTYVYHNVFDISYDSVVIALSNLGYSNLSIIVGAIGWPTDGGINANSSNAQRFNQGFLDHLASGTPRQPNTVINFYMLSLIDEDLKDISLGGFERHWGLFQYDGKPKYSLSFSSNNEEKITGAVGVEYLAQQWCIFDSSIVDTSTLPDSVQYACNNADCTALGYGSSCNTYLNASGNASYAFNAYFQRQNQDVGACSFNGLGRIVSENPSNGSCEFAIQLAYGSSGSSSIKKQISMVLLVLMLVVVAF